MEIAALPFDAGIWRGPGGIELETKQMYDLYQKIYPRKWFQRPKPQPFNDWLYEQLSGQPD